MTSPIRLIAVAAATLLAAPIAWSKATPTEIERLGKDLTCVGAERAGNADGSIPPYAGKWLGAPQGVHHASGQPYADPYAADKPLFVISAANAEQYAARLSDGQKALLKKYPQTFRMAVYPSRRDFRYADWVCDAAKKNAAGASIVDEGEGVDALTGAAPFPLPKTGFELLWNSMLPTRAWKEIATYDQAVVYPNGNIAEGRVKYDILAPANDPNPKERPKTEGPQAHFFVTTLAPERNKGEIYVGQTYYNYKRNPSETWVYNPGTRRVRQAPQFGFDFPQGPGGFRTVDDDRLFNGSPERYDWKIVGKREVYIPYDAYRFDDPKLEYAEILKTAGHVNPDVMRYELHRVWVLEAALKPNVRHSYAKRVFYIDEDTWHAVMADSYDARGQLWRVGMQNYLYAYDMQAFQARALILHDLMSGAYLVDRMVNKQPVPKLNTGDLKPADFTPDAARQAGR
ncbi:MAG TPA: DUF1329 domain-containing protein [Burkholderiaceae bacterium]|jgi:hypothetical protein